MAKKPSIKLVKQTKADVQAIVNNAITAMDMALTAVDKAGSADGQCVLALHSLYLHGIRCEQTVNIMLKSFKGNAKSPSVNARISRLSKVAGFIDAGKKLPNADGDMVHVGSMLVRKVVDGLPVPASLQGIYKSLTTKPKSQAKAREDAQFAIIQVMCRDESKGGGDWLLEEESVTFMLSEYEKVMTKRADAEKEKAAKAAKKNAA